MRGKAGLLIGAGIGYVLGTRDGRGRYDQIKQQTTRLRHDPRVQEKAGQAQDLVKEKAPQAQQAVTDAAQKVVHKASDAVSSNDSGSDVPPPTDPLAGPTIPTNANPYPGPGQV